MATQRQVQAAKRNMRKARAGAQKKRSIANLPAQTRRALAKQGAAVAKRKRTGGSTRRMERPMALGVPIGPAATWCKRAPLREP
jgi:hypothetical protein